MFEEMKYRWALRNYLRELKTMEKSFEDMPEDDPEKINDEPRYKWVMGRELNFQATMIDQFRSKYLVDQAYKYHVPVPTDEDSWESNRLSSDQFLTPAAAQKLRADIRAEQKADWEYWANRVTLALALIGSIFGVLAFFRK